MTAARQVHPASRRIANGTVLLVLLALAALLPTTGFASDRKIVDPSICQPHTISAPDYSLLKIRADGVTNYHGSSKYVICPLPKDAQVAWGHPGSGNWSVDVLFRQRWNGWVPRVESNACTLLVTPWPDHHFFAGIVQASRHAVHHTTMPGQSLLLASVRFTQDDLALPPASLPEDYRGYGGATLVCRVAPGNTLRSIVLEEHSFTDVEPVAGRPYSGGDDHPYSLASCKHYGGPVPDYNLLRIRADGIVNIDGAARYVICPMPVDAEPDPQDVTSFSVSLLFKRSTADIANSGDRPNQCAALFFEGSVLRHAIVSSGPRPFYGAASWAETTFGSDGIDSIVPGMGNVALVCRIMPGARLASIVFDESGAQTD